MATKLGDLTVGADGSWSSGPHAMTAGAKTVTLRRKSDGAVLATRGFSVAGVSVSLSDSFDRANNASLGSDWVTLTGCANPYVQINRWTSTAEAASYWNPSANSVPANQFSECVGYGGAGPAVRMSASAKTGYRARLTYDYGPDDGTFIALLERIVGGSVMQLGVDGGGHPATVTLRLEVSGTSLAVMVDGVTVISGITDSNISTGQPGIWSFANGTTDSWAGGSL